MKMKNLCAAVCAIVCLIAAAGTALAQGTDLGQIRGSVTDASNAVVPGAKITVTDVATNTPRGASVNDSGEYEVPNLKPGAYIVTVAAPGFNTLALSGVDVVSGTTVRADARLEVAKSSESVTVQAEASAVQTASPTISGTLNNRELIEIPRDSRDIYEFLYLNPSIIQSANGDGSFKYDPTNPGPQGLPPDFEVRLI